MSDIESSSVRLEDGEIDEESNEAPSTCASSPGGCIDDVHLRREAKATGAGSKLSEVEKTSHKAVVLQGDKVKSPEPKKQSDLASKSIYLEDGSDFFDEDEMLCVRGASPPPFTKEQTSRILRRSPQYESDSYSTLSTYRSKISKKRRRKRKSKSKRNSKDQCASSSEDQQNSKSKEAAQPSNSQPKQKQLCKFYIQECCAKGEECEYMHSEFPCKFFYMGLQCEDEVACGTCKLSHGGTLSCEMLVALIRHIHTAPSDVLGGKFVELRSKMTAAEASKMVHEMQEKLQSPAREPESTIPKPDADLIATLRDKLYFLREEQIDKLYSLCISKPEDLLRLTLAQLNEIGIHAIQIEAIQRSLIEGKDGGMRTSLRSAELVQPKKDAVDRELAASNDSNWDEDETPLVIDESEDEDENREKVATDEDDSSLIDIVGCSSSSVYSQLSPRGDDKTQEKILETLSKCNPNNEKRSSAKIERTTTAKVSREYKTHENLQSIAGLTVDNDILEDTRRDVWEYNEELQMEVDSCSENWDSDEKQSEPQNIKKVEFIASPDYSDDEASGLFSSTTCALLHSRTPNLDNYTPALEIDGHLTYPAMEYKLYEIQLLDSEVNKPPLLDKLLKSNSTDPRLQKFLEKEKNYGIFPQTDYSFFSRSMPQGDPRVRTGYGNNFLQQNYNASPILYGYLQGSRWYQELKSNLKIQINHSVATLVHALNAFHKDPSPKKIFDLFQIECAGVLLEVMRNVGIFIDVNGVISEEKNYQQLCAPQQQTSQSYNNTSGTPAQDNGSGGNPPIKPGLLGFAPPGIRFQPPRVTTSSNEYSFMRQAFGNQCFGTNNSEFHPHGSGFYVGNRDFNRRRGTWDHGGGTLFGRPPVRNLKRRL